jgi:Flp pilus assembly pilin Flp
MGHRMRVCYPYADRGIFMRELLIRFVGDKRATTTIEYGLITALIVVVMIAALNTLGANLNSHLLVIGNGIN